MFQGVCDALKLSSCDAVTVAQTLGGFSGVLAAAFALIAVPLAWWQITEGRKVQAQATLYQTALEYFELRQRHQDMWLHRADNWYPTEEDRKWLGIVPVFVVQQAHFIDVVLACARLVSADRIKILLPLMIRDFLIAVRLDEMVVKRQYSNVAAAGMLREESVFTYAGNRLLALCDVAAPLWARDFSNHRLDIVAAIEKSENKYQ